EIVDKMLAKDPAARFQTPAEVAERLAQLAGGSSAGVEQVYILPDVPVDDATRPLAPVTEKSPARKSRETARPRRRRGAEKGDESATPESRQSTAITVLSALSLGLGGVMTCATGGLLTCFVFKDATWVTLPFSVIGMGLGAVALYLGVRARPRR